MSAIDAVELGAPAPCIHEESTTIGLSSLVVDGAQSSLI